MPSLSAIVLTKDSERTIEACVKALKPAVDHVIVVDTGSSDNTVQIAKECGARVYSFEWRDDFSAARNFGDSLATSDWVIHVDSDEILRIEDTDKIRKMCAQYKKTVKPIAVEILQINIMQDGNAKAHPVCRLYKRNTVIWRGIIHEQPFVKRDDTLYSIHSDIGFLHDGYNTNAVDTREKFMRNIRLLKRGLDDEPNNAAYHFFLARDYTLVDEYVAAIQHFRLAIGLMQEQKMVSQLERAYRLYIACLEEVKDYSAAQEVANEMVGKFNGYTDGWYTPSNTVRESTLSTEPR